jgi:hypothetical protein
MAIRLGQAVKSAGIVFFIGIFHSVKNPGATTIADRLVAGVPKWATSVPKRKGSCRAMEKLQLEKWRTEEAAYHFSAFNICGTLWV